MIQSSLRPIQAPMPFLDNQLSEHLNFIMQSAEYLGLKISRDDAAVLLTHYRKIDSIYT